MARTKSTTAKSGIEHGIKKPKATTTKVVKKESKERERRSANRAILNAVQNLPEADLNENLGKKIKSEEIKVENVKEEEETNDSLLEGEEDMSEYERIRQQNIQERMDMFKEILDVKKRVSEAFTPKTQEKREASKRGLASVKREKEILPPRKSARLEGGKVPEITRYVPELAPEPEYTGYPLETLDAKTIFKYDEDEKKLENAQEYMSQFCKEITEPKIKSSKSSQEYMERMKKWKIKPELVAKVVPDRIFSIDLHPTAHKLLASAGGKWGALGLWDIMDKDSEENGVHMFKYHSRPINWQSWDRFNSENLITTSYDGTSRILDLNKMESRLMYGDEKFIDSSGSYATMHQQIDANTFLVAKGKTGCVGLVDLRSGYQSVVQDYNVFDRISPKCLSLHPMQTNILMAANNKGGVFIFDLRTAGKGRSGLMESLAELVGHARSVSSAVFNSTGNKVATLSWDDKLRLFDTSVMKGQMTGNAVKHNNNTGRWLTPFKGLWHPVHEDVYFSGSMAQPREIEAWHATAKGMQKIHQFRGEDFGSISSVLAVHPTQDIIIGGNASGRVFAFM